MTSAVEIISGRRGGDTGLGQQLSLLSRVAPAHLLSVEVAALPSPKHRRREAPGRRAHPEHTRDAHGGRRTTRPGHPAPDPAKRPRAPGGPAWRLWGRRASPTVGSGALLQPGPPEHLVHSLPVAHHQQAPPHDGGLRRKVSRGSAPPGAPRPGRALGERRPATRPRGRRSAPPTSP